MKPNSQSRRKPPARGDKITCMKKEIQGIGDRIGEIGAARFRQMIDTMDFRFINQVFWGEKK